MVSSRSGIECLIKKIVKIFYIYGYFWIAGDMSTIMCLFLNDGELFCVANECNEKRLKTQNIIQRSICNKKKYIYNGHQTPIYYFKCEHRWR